MFDWLKGLAGKSAPSATMNFTDWRRSAGVDDATYAGLDSNSVAGLQQAHVTTPVNSGFGMSDMTGMLGGIAQVGQLGLGLANYGLQKDQFAFNKMNANRNYEAEKTKYNNAVDRTAAINDFYGSKNTATRIG